MVKLIGLTPIVLIKILGISLTTSKSIFSPGSNPSACESSPCGQNSECFSASSDPNNYFCKCQDGVVAKYCNSTSIIQIVFKFQEKIFTKKPVLLEI